MFSEVSHFELKVFGFTFSWFFRWFWSVGWRQYVPHMSQRSPCWYMHRSPYLQLMLPSALVIVDWMYGHRVASIYCVVGPVWVLPWNTSPSSGFPDTIWAYEIVWLLTNRMNVSVNQNKSLVVVCCSKNVLTLKHLHQRYWADPCHMHFVLYNVVWIREHRSSCVWFH